MSYACPTCGFPMIELWATKRLGCINHGIPDEGTKAFSIGMAKEHLKHAKTHLANRRDDQALESLTKANAAMGHHPAASHHLAEAAGHRMQAHNMLGFAYGHLQNAAEGSQAEEATESPSQEAAEDAAGTP